MLWRPTAKRAGQNNLQTLADNLQNEGGEWQNATNPISDPAIEEAGRWAKIQALHRLVDNLEANGLHQDDLIYQLEHMGQGKNSAVVKMMNATGTVISAKVLRLQRIVPKPRK